MIGIWSPPRPDPMVVCALAEGGGMIIESIQVRNFRSLRDSTLSCNRLTALLGPNGTGKSAFLKALDLFYSSTAAVTEEDFYDRDISKERSVRVTFRGLSDEAKRLFSKYTEGENLSVEKVFRITGGRIGKRRALPTRETREGPVRAGGIRLEVVGSGRESVGRGGGEAQARGLWVGAGAPGAGPGD